MPHWHTAIPIIHFYRYTMPHWHTAIAIIRFYRYTMPHWHTAITIIRFYRYTMPHWHTAITIIHNHRVVHGATLTHYHPQSQGRTRCHTGTHTDTLFIRYHRYTMPLAHYPSAIIDTQSPTDTLFIRYHRYTMPLAHCTATTTYT